MKPNLTRTILLLAAFILFYSACKKDIIKRVPVTTTTAKPVDFAALSSQVALTFYKSINGQYGGTDVSKGIKSPFSTKTGRLLVNSISPLCGFVIDTAYNYSIETGPIHAVTDTFKTYSGRFRFQFTCTSGNVDGYNVADTVKYVEANLYTFYNGITVTQDYSVKALDQTYKLVSMDGTLTSGASYVQTFDEYGSSLGASYVLAGLRVNFASGIADIIQGTVTFHIVYYVPHSFDIPYNSTPYIYDGSIQFLGNHKAKLTINPGHVYMVDLLTGVVTPV